jgi:hypothetical protein
MALDLCKALFEKFQVMWAGKFLRATFLMDYSISWIQTLWWTFSTSKEKF